MTRRACLAAIYLLVSGVGCSVLRPWDGPAVPAVATVVVDSSQIPALYAYLQSRVAAGETASARPWVAVLPFADESGFRRGLWDLRHGVPRMLSTVLASGSAWQHCPVRGCSGGGRRGPAAARGRDAPGGAGAEGGVDILLQGALLDLDMERLHVGDPMLGGYKSYRGVAELEVVAVYAEDGGVAGTAHGGQESLERGMGLDLLGKPREQDLQFPNLAQMEFGSEEFRETAVGRATAAAMEEAVGQLVLVLRPGGVDLAGTTPRILAIDGEEIIINLRSEQGVRRRNPLIRFAVLPATEHRERDRLNDGVPVGVVVQDLRT